MTTFVIEISNPSKTNGDPYERSEGSLGEITKRLRREVGRPLTKAERIFLSCGARVRHEDQETGRTVTAFKKLEQGVAA